MTFYENIFCELRLRQYLWFSFALNNKISYVPILDKSIRLRRRTSTSMYPLSCCRWCSCRAGHCGRAPQGSPERKGAPSSTPSPAPAPPCWEPPAWFWTGRKRERHLAHTGFVFFMVMPSWKQLALEVGITTWPICTGSVQTGLGPGGPWEQLQSNDLSVDTWCCKVFLTHHAHTCCIYSITACNYYAPRIVLHLQSHSDIHHIHLESSSTEY